ncbi:MAG: hypothetical protein EHM48_00175 [Planctomycetaceae bacterium]|nr:MAG: hypothetical protein EHM48_00175 [Planctomycetaceae bacterium]
MTKSELCVHIEEALRTEEAANIVYMEHLTAIVTRSGLSPEKIKTARQICEYLIDWNNQHSMRLKQLLLKLNGESANDF